MPTDVRAYAGRRFYADRRSGYADRRSGRLARRAGAVASGKALINGPPTPVRTEKSWKSPLPVSKANLAKLIKQRDAAKTPGVKAGLTKKVKAMEAQLAAK
jgi:hypothetical protein